MIGTMYLKDIPGYEGLYAVTENGQIWSYKSYQFLKPKIQTMYRTKNSRGYKHVYYYLYKDNKKKSLTAARLVALTYIPNPNNLPEVDHIDRDSTNNNVNNLHWVTRSENNKNRDNSFLMATAHKANRMAALKLSKPIAQIDIKTNEVINTFTSVRDASRVVFDDVNKNSLINKCAHHKCKTAYGFRWEFI